ncbi:hypothetical protein Gpo141_00002897 [Globisporangium polare]
MLKGLTKDLTGTADICSIVSADFSKLDASAYVLSASASAPAAPHQKEEILFAFASAKEQFAFTNEALITVCGENATTTRKVVERIEYRDARIRNVQFETTGRVDRDCEIKFVIGDHDMSIDIAKKEENEAKRYYKALVALAREQGERSRRWDFAQNGLTNAAESLKLGDSTVGHEQRSSGRGLVGQANQVLEWLSHDFERLNARCYKDVIVNALANATIQ